MYSLQDSLHDKDKHNNYQSDLNNIILQEQKEYKKLSEAYNLMYQLKFYYQNQIKTHQIQFDILKQKILENGDIQDISLKINKIFEKFRIKNYSNNIIENIKTLYSYILHLHIINQENLTNFNNTNKILIDIKCKIDKTYDLLKIDKTEITTDEYYNLIFKIINNIIEENQILKNNYSANNIELITKIKQLEDENKKLININDKLKQSNTELNNEINKLIKLEDEYNDYKVKQEEFLKLSNKTINDIHKKEIINLNEIQKQRIEENKKLLKINKELSKEVMELKKGFADLDEYKKQIIMLSKDVNSIKNSVSVQNFNEINEFNDSEPNSHIKFERNIDNPTNLKDIEYKTHSKSLSLTDSSLINSPSAEIISPLIKNTSFKRNNKKSPKEQLKEWFSKIDNKYKIRKQDIPDIHFKNTSLIILLCKARNYYNLDNVDKMTYGQFKNYLYTISEVRNELL